MAHLEGPQSARPFAEGINRMTMWNYTGNILPGLSNSGTTILYSVSKVVGETHDSFAYSPSFGLGGALLCTIVYLLTALVFYMIGRKGLNRSLCRKLSTGL